jgi:hypothetical protein
LGLLAAVPVAADDLAFEHPFDFIHREISND